jgi:hypothetical protein
MTMRENTAQHGGVADPHGPTGQQEFGLASTEKARGEGFGLVGEGGFVQQGNVAFAHHVQVHGVKGGHHENAAQEAVDLELGVQHSGEGARDHAPQKAGESCRQWRPLVDQEDGRHRRPEGDGAVGSDVGEIEDAEAEIDS